MRIELETMPYELSHGRSPKGRGSWAFCPFHKRNADNAMDFTLLSPNMTYTEARKWIKAEVANKVFSEPLEQDWQSTLWAVLP